jgi:hypothetical protein
MRPFQTLLRQLALALVAATPLIAAPEEVNPVETKLREAVRDTMLKLRDAQGQVAAAQAAQIAAEAKIKELTAKNETLGKELVAERNVSANMISDLTTKLDERAALITSLQASIEKWKKSYNGATALAAKKESERAKFEARSIELDRLVNALQVKNIEMFKAGMDTLDRYEKFGFGDALLAREPFIGTTRVKFKNAIQDQTDKLTEARIKPQDPNAPPNAGPAAPGSSQPPAAQQNSAPPEPAPAKKTDGADDKPPVAAAPGSTKPAAQTKTGAKAAPFEQGTSDTDAKPAKKSKPQA